MVNRTKTSLSYSKLIISALGCRGMNVVSMSLSVCVVSVCMMSTRELECVRVATGCQSGYRVSGNMLSIKQLGEGWQ